MPSPLSNRRPQTTLALVSLLAIVAALSLGVESLAAVGQARVKAQTKRGVPPPPYALPKAEARRNAQLEEVWRNWLGHSQSPPTLILPKTHLRKKPQGYELPTKAPPIDFRRAFGKLPKAGRPRLATPLLAGWFGLERNWQPLTRDEIDTAEYLRRLGEKLSSAEAGSWRLARSRRDIDQYTVRILSEYHRIDDPKDRAKVDEAAVALLPALGFSGDSVGASSSVQEFQAHYNLPQTGTVDRDTAVLIARDWTLVASARSIASAQASGATPPNSVVRSHTQIFASATEGSQALVLADPANPQLLSLSAFGTIRRYPRGADSLGRFRAAQAGASTQARSAWHDNTRAFGAHRPDTGTSGRRMTTIELLWRDPASQLTQRFIDLGGRGDATLLTTPNGNRILIDSGMTREAADRIAEVLPSELRLTVFGTHPDVDHIGNFAPLMRNGRLAVEEFVMSSFVTHTRTQRALLDLLKTLGYTETRFANSAFSDWRRGQRAPSYTRMPLSPSIGNQRSEIALFTATPEEGIRVDVMQLRNPTTSNESSLITAVSHNGHTTLHAADMAPETIRTLNEHYRKEERARGGNEASTGTAGQLPANVDVLKYPHHAWLPKDAETIREWAQLLRTWNPGEVILSVGLTDLPGQSADKVRAFLEEVLPHSRVSITREDGDIQLLTRLLDPGPRHAPSAFGDEFTRSECRGD
jgi:hypothetical protein